MILCHIIGCHCHIIYKIIAWMHSGIGIPIKVSGEHSVDYKNYLLNGSDVAKVLVSWLEIVIFYQCLLTELAISVNRVGLLGSLLICCEITC